MPVLGAIVEAKAGKTAEVKSGLASLHTVNIYGEKDSQIVVVIECKTLKAINRTIKEISALPEVVGVYLVYGGDYE